MGGIVEPQRAYKHDLRFEAQAASKNRQKLLFINSRGTRDLSIVQQELFQDFRCAG